MAKTIKYFLVAIIILYTSCTTSKKNQAHLLNQYNPASKALYDTIARLDSLFFEAFNTRKLDLLKSILSPDLEFYHDGGGLTDYQQNIDAFEKTFASERKLRRELVKSSLEVYPINRYGAIETGVHRFYATEKGGEEKLSSEAKFVQIWQQKDGAWQLTRIVSFGHQEYLK